MIKQFNLHKDLTDFLKKQVPKAVIDETDNGYVFSGTEYAGSFTTDKITKKIELDLLPKFSPDETLSTKTKFN